MLLEDAERVKEELTKQEEAAARLEDLGKHVCKEAELAPKAKECLALLTPLPALSAGQGLGLGLGLGLGFGFGLGFGLGLGLGSTLT